MTPVCFEKKNTIQIPALAWYVLCARWLAAWCFGASEKAKKTSEASGMHLHPWDAFNVKVVAIKFHQWLQRTRGKSVGKSENKNNNNDNKSSQALLQNHLESFNFFSQRLPLGSEDRGAFTQTGAL